MFLICVLSVLLVVFFICLNRQSKFAYLLASDFIVIALTLTIASIYMAKCSLYPKMSTLDYAFYTRMHNITLSMSSLSRMYNFCFAALMVIGVSYLRFFTKISYAKMLLLFIPIAAMLIWYDRSTAEYVWLAINKSDFILDYLLMEKILNNAFSFIFIVYVLFPLCLPLTKILKTKIFACRHENMFLEFLMATAACFVLYAFVFGPLRDVFLSNTIGISKLPVIAVEQVKYSKLFMIYTLTLTAILLIYTFKNNLYRINSVHLSLLFRKNISMQLHSYKNAFTSVAMQLNLAKIHLSKDNKDACLSHIEHGMSTLNKYSDIFIRNLRLLSNNYNEKSSAPINLVSCIESALAICNDDEIKITRSYDSDIVYIYGQQYHITEVFVNILNNAVTAVNKISRIPDIKINLKIEAEWCMAEIIDNGIGIKKSKKRLIFEPFYSTNCYNNGSGIGLYYTKKIVKAHNGEIRCDSHPGVYTRFQIAFPVIMKGE